MSSARPVWTRQSGSVDNCFPCALFLVILGVGVATYSVDGELGNLPTWAKVAGPIVAILILGVGWVLGGSEGGFTDPGDFAVPEEPPADAGQEADDGSEEPPV